MSKLVHNILEERLAHEGFQCLTRKVHSHGMVRYEVFIAHPDGRKGQMVNKRRTDALMSLIQAMDMPELTCF